MPIRGPLISTCLDPDGPGLWPGLFRSIKRGTWWDSDIDHSSEHDGRCYEGIGVYQRHDEEARKRTIGQYAIRRGGWCRPSKPRATTCVRLQLLSALIAIKKYHNMARRLQVPARGVSGVRGTGPPGQLVIPVLPYWGRRSFGDTPKRQLILSQREEKGQ